MGWTRRAPASRIRKPAWGYEYQEAPVPATPSSTNVIATIGIDIGKNAFHVIGLDDKGAIILRHKQSRGQVYARLANIPPCLIRKVRRTTSATRKRLPRLCSVRP